jgi:hypothetical protein
MNSSITAEPPNIADGSLATIGLPVVLEWHRRAGINNIGHTRASTFCDRRAKAAGVVATIFSTAGGTALFATLSQSPSVWLRAVAGTVTFIATVAVAIAIALSWAKLSGQHQAAGNTFGASAPRD